MFEDNVIDITHYSKRTQAGNVLRAGTAFSKPVVDTAPMTKDIPVAVTIETAIQYFNDNAVGEKSVLYKMTAEWLENYRSIAHSTAKRILSEAQEDNVLTVDVSEEEDNE